ncbi:hypothetical protein Agub_g2491 [Astrephomene gubernaculifera]|uniref:Zinc/iron permease n=1 Tax=Astrephomene gubernaculifera TaxID=47775 RepID=A0AAD3DJA4_9CHLO|nr:hypothetical protein Agub_g2491 [Astrephomene gubernaculifera]
MSRHLLGMVEEAPADLELNSASDELVKTVDTLGLRIAAVFIILLAGLLGGLPPLFLKAFQRQESLQTFLIRAFSAGVILALALVHIVPDAIQDLADIGGIKYPIGGTSILFGIAAMIFIEHGAHMMYGIPHVHHSDAAPPARPLESQTQSLPTQQPSAIGEGCEDDAKASCRGNQQPGHAHAHAHPHPPQPPMLQQQEDKAASCGHPQHLEHQQENPLRDQQLPLPAPTATTAATSTAAFARRSAGPSLGHRSAGAGSGPCGSPLAATSLPLFSSSDCTLARSECSTPHGGAMATGGTASAAAAASTALLLHCAPDHCHDCVSRSSAPNWASAVEVSAAGDSPLRLRIIAYLFELGCIFHSFIIGLSLGVNQTSMAQVRALLIALSFHQALEGLSLASVINRGGFSGARAALMVAMYGVTCPAGVAIGIAIAKSYEPESLQARAAQGVLNGVSGGMLLYISLVQLIAEDMGKYVTEPSSSSSSSKNAHGSGPTGRSGCHASGGSEIGYRIRMPSFLAFCAGAASMCLLAVWA